MSSFESPAQYTSDELETLEVFKEHIKSEITGDLDKTMETMVASGDGSEGGYPYVNHIPTMQGATGDNNVKDFYRNSLVGKMFPPDMEMTEIATTIGKDRIIQELYVSFTHTTFIDWFLPNVQPTNKRVDVLFCVIVGVDKLQRKLTYERIYWDQAGVLVQLGLLNPSGLPVAGVEGTERMLEYIQLKKHSEKL